MRIGWVLRGFDDSKGGLVGSRYDLMDLSGIQNRSREA